MNQITTVREPRRRWRHRGAVGYFRIAAVGVAISLLSWLALSPVCALALPHFSLTGPVTVPGQEGKFYGDGTSKIAACVKNGNAGVSGVSFLSLIHI